MRKADVVLPEPAPRAAEPAQTRHRPEVELHPTTAAERGIAAGNWVEIVKAAQALGHASIPVSIPGLWWVNMVGGRRVIKPTRLATTLSRRAA
jgi:hypothetical protein